MPVSILIVDNDRTTRESLAKALSSSYTIHEAGNGVEAMTVLQEHRDIAVVLSDLEMPEMNGTELMGKLKAREETLATILMTASALDSSEQMFLQSRADVFLPKPVDLPSLESAIQFLMKKRQGPPQHFGKDLP